MKLSKKSSKNDEEDMRKLEDTKKMLRAITKHISKAVPKDEGSY